MIKRFLLRSCLIYGIVILVHILIFAAWKTLLRFYPMRKNFPWKLDLDNVITIGFWLVMACVLLIFLKEMKEILNRVRDLRKHAEKIDDDFADVLNVAFKDDMGLRISDRSESEKLTIVERLLHHATKEICIFSNSYESNFWNSKQILDCFDDALRKNVQVLIATNDWTDETTKGKAMQKWNEQVKNGFPIKIQKRKNLTVQASFIVVDEEAFRFEADKNSKGSGFTYIRHKGMARPLKECFNRIMNLIQE